MSVSRGSIPAAPPHSGAVEPTLHDTRRFWRILLAIIAPLPMLAKAADYLLYPTPSDDSFAASVEAFAAHEKLVVVLQWLDAVFVVGLIPAVAAVAWATRRATPRLTTVAAFITMSGFLAAIAILPNGDRDALVTVQNGLDVAAVGRLSDALDSNPVVGLASLGFIVALLIGLPLLGLALWRSRVAPAWMGSALIVGAFTHPFLQVSHVLVAAGLVVAAVGFGGATVALLRQSDDEFDLPPVAVAP